MARTSVGVLPNFARLLYVQPQLWRFAKRKPLGAIGGLIIAAMLVTAVTAPWIAPSDLAVQDYDSLFAAPSRHFLMGTDELGRDVLSRVIFGTRLSAMVATVAVAFGAGAGFIIGMVSGYAGGRVDLLVQRVVDMIMGFPPLVIAIVVVASLGTSTVNVIIALSVVIGPQTTRMLRSETLGVKAQPYIESARSIGAGPVRIVVRHIAPNTLATFMILITLLWAQAFLTEAALSFLGLGPPPPAASLGRMLSAAREYMSNAPWLAVFPGLAITGAIFGISLLGDALRDVWDPRLRGGEAHG